MKLGFLLSLSLSASMFAAEPLVENFIKHGKANSAGTVAYSYDASVYSPDADLKDLPIGVFDSGIGGLTVLEAILTLDAYHNDTLNPGADGRPDFENERFIYFGDQANMPYGNYSSAGKTDYLRELILKDATFLLGRRWFDPKSQTFRQDKPPVKAVVIACNTATAYGIEDIRAIFQAWKVPVKVVGVVEAGARGVQESRPAASGSIGVLATVGTCASGAYPRVIGQTLGLAGRPVPSITQQGSIALAGVIEGDPVFTQSVGDCAYDDIRALLEAHRKTANPLPLSTLVLGCTHFPLAKAELTAALTAHRMDPAFSSLIAPEVTFVDPAEWTARELFRTLASARLRRRPPPTEPDLFYLSFPNPLRKNLPLTPEGGLEKDFKYGRETGALDREDTVNAPLRRDDLPAVGRKLVEGRLPAVWKSMGSR
ncbi:aspartate/glutamate racemase family protein [Prosthecobacter sp. SYSU 5D2]|uniref:glutamate racemase n=1 Tax=Prosthecobacter sp. SYSU 5D2 TaxID=3134134 RepID=UPI0031FE86B6